MGTQLVRRSYLRIFQFFLRLNALSHSYHILLVLLIGGSIGKNKEEMRELLQFVMPKLSVTEKPIHLLGMGDTESIDFGVTMGVDTFDSSFPTRAGRHGTLFTSNGPLKIEKQQHAEQFTSRIDNNCDCYTCQHYSVAYLHHLFKVDEPTCGLLGTIHNLRWLIKRMENIRVNRIHTQAIKRFPKIIFKMKNSV